MSQNALTPLQMLIEAQRNLAQELSEQRKTNMSLQESIYNLAGDIKVLNSQISKHDDLEQIVSGIASDIRGLRQELKAEILDAIDAKLKTRDEKIELLQKMMFRAGGAIGIVVLLITNFETIVKLFKP